MGLVALGRRGYSDKPLSATGLPELPSIGYWDAPHDQTWGVACRRNEGIKLTFQARGKLDSAVDEQTFSQESDHFTITRPHHDGGEGGILLGLHSDAATCGDQQTSVASAPA